MQLTQLSLGVYGGAGYVFVDGVVEYTDEVERLFPLVPVRAFAEPHRVRHSLHYWCHLEHQFKVLQLQAKKKLKKSEYNSCGEIKNTECHHLYSSRECRTIRLPEQITQC